VFDIAAQRSADGRCRRPSCIVTGAVTAREPVTVVVPAYVPALAVAAAGPLLGILLDIEESRAPLPGDSGDVAGRGTRRGTRTRRPVVLLVHHFGPHARVDGRRRSYDRVEGGTK